MQPVNHGFIRIVSKCLTILSLLTAIVTSSCHSSLPVAESQPTETPTVFIFQPTTTVGIIVTLIPITLSPEPHPTSSNPTCVPSHDHSPLASVDFKAYPQAILDFINSGASIQELDESLYNAGIANQPVAVMIGDMTGDNKMDVVVSIYDPASLNVPPAGTLLIYICQADQYRLALNQPTGKAEGGPHLWYLQDLSASGRADLVDSVVTCGDNTCVEEVKIWVWDGSSFINRLKGSTTSLSMPVIKINDANANGIYELDVTGQEIGSAGTESQSEVTWVWTYLSESGYWERTGIIPRP